MKKVLIQLVTEFHYMVALSIIEKYYNTPEFEIHFLINKHSSASKSRLDNVKLDDRFKYHFVSFDHNRNERYNDVIQFMDYVKQNQFYHFVSFLFHDPLFVYLTHYFKKKDTVSYLAPDGLAAYAKFTKSTLRSRVLNTVNSYKFFRKHNLSFNKLWLTSWNFGENGYYDYIYAYSKTLPYVSSDKKVIEIDYTLSEENLRKLKEMFSIDFSSYPALDDVILIVNHRHTMLDYETKLIEMLRELYPQKTVLFKKHPNQPVENLSYLDKFDHIYKIFDVYPVEMLIASLNNSIIISPYTTSMLYHNPTCKYFWTYPIVTASGALKKPVERHNPKDYIKVVSTFEELRQDLAKL